MAKLSQWHDISIDPVHVGVYELDIDSELKYAFWCGEEFHGAWPSIESAWRNKDYSDGVRLNGSCIHATGWRGIVK